MMAVLRKVKLPDQKIYIAVVSKNNGKQVKGLAV